MTDWQKWHEGYDDPESALSHRLRAVQDQIRTWLDGVRPGPLHVTSACSGLGLDLLGALEGHPRRGDVHAVLVELDEELVARSQALFREAGLTQVEVRCADAGRAAAYAAAPPADLLVLCGIFGNTSDDDVRRTVEAASALCAPGATAIWTRHRREPDLTPAIRQWWEGAGWDEVAFVSVGPDTPSVGVARLRAEPDHQLPEHLFVFR